MSSRRIDMPPERSALSDLYRQHGHCVLRRARQLLGSDGEAEEMLHVIFLKLAEEPGQLTRLENPVGWLYSATTYACFNRIRDQKTRARLLHEQASAGVTTDAGPEPRVVVERLLSRLPDEVAAALVYYHLDQMTHSEIAEVLGCSRRHVGHLLERAREHLASVESEP